MPPQSRDQAGPEEKSISRAERRTSGRAQRKIAAEEAARRKQWTIVGGAIAAVLIAALIYVFVNRPQEAAAPVLAAEPLPASIPVEGMTMGAGDAPVTIVEWGDYT